MYFGNQLTNNNPFSSNWIPKQLYHKLIPKKNTSCNVQCDVSNECAVILYNTWKEIKQGNKVYQKQKAIHASIEKTKLQELGNWRLVGKYYHTESIQV